jgi:hypothetical protein
MGYLSRSLHVDCFTQCHIIQSLRFAAFGKSVGAIKILIAPPFLGGRDVLLAPQTCLTGPLVQQWPKKLL